MTAILVRFPNESIKLDDVEENPVLPTLEVIYHGGLKLKISDALKAPSEQFELSGGKSSGRTRAPS